MQNYSEFYQNINLPFFAPPEWLFGLAWGIIYPLIFFALAYLLYLVLKKQAPFYLLSIFVINIIANLLFTPLLLKLGSFFWATVDIWIVLVTLAFLEFKVYKNSKLVFWLLLPYLIWGSFATALQVAIFLIN